MAVTVPAVDGVNETPSSTAEESSAAAVRGSLGSEQRVVVVVVVFRVVNDHDWVDIVAPSAVTSPATLTLMSAPLGRVAPA